MQARDSSRSLAAMAMSGPRTDPKRAQNLLDQEQGAEDPLVSNNFPQGTPTHNLADDFEQQIEEGSALLHIPLRKTQKSWGAAKMFLAGACCAAFLCACLVSLRGESPPMAQKALHVHEVVMLDDVTSGSESSDKPKCFGKSVTDWDQLALADMRVPTALNMSFKLGSLKRMQCKHYAPPLDWDPIVFIDDKFRDKTVEVMHKYSADCSGETFMLHFAVMGNPSTTFNMEVYYNHGTHLWTLLGTDPTVCNLLAGPGTSAAPLHISPGCPAAKAAAQFAVGEINFRAKENNCVNGNKKVSLGSIKEASVVMKVGLMYTITCQLHYGSYSYTATLHIIQRCSGAGKNGCFYQLELPEGRASVIHPDAVNTPWCDPLSFRGEKGEFNATGVIDEDRTNSFTNQRVLLYDRKLSDNTREPLQERYIQIGDVPEMHDPRADDCFIQEAVYNQGFCNSGYANAWAGMMGVRKCMYDKVKVRRVQEVEEEKKQCGDDPNWSAFGAGAMDCDYFKEHGCGGVDYGQITHCRLSCDSCPKTTEMGGSNPWAAANYKYMPSVEDIATCSVSPDGKASGCLGGNMWQMWDNNLAKSKRPMWTAGDNCKPYTLKCWNEHHLVNPLNEGLCWTYEGYELWHKPCSCIPADKRPSSLPKCDAEAPSGDCEFIVPAAAFVVRGLSSGLSSEEAMLNYQRHILESGPLYVPVTTTLDFFTWDWKKNPVYTGGGVLAGGTAMMILGWGGGGYSYIKTPFWILRNSWGADWQEKGTCLWLRGKNLMGIENQAGITMSGADFKDWSAPICRMTSWSRQWSTDGNTLTNYTMKIKVRCSEDCEVKAFFSNGHGNGNAAEQAGWHATGIVRQFYGKKHEDVEAPTISLHLRGYGLKDESMFLAIQATDGALNTGETVNVFTIPEIPKVTKIQETVAAELDEVVTTAGPEEEETATTPAVPGVTENPSVMKQEKADKVAVQVDALKEKKAKISAQLADKQKQKEQTQEANEKERAANEKKKAQTQEANEKERAANEKKAKKTRAENMVENEKDAKTRAEATKKKKEAHEKQMSKIQVAKAKQEDVNKEQKKKSLEEKAEAKEEAQAEKAKREVEFKKDNEEVKAKREKNAKISKAAHEKAESDSKIKAAESKTKREVEHEKERAEHEAKKEAKEKALAVKKESNDKKESEVKKEKEEVQEAKKKEAQTKQDAKAE